MPHKTERTVKVEHFKNLVAVAIADGFFDAPEMDFLIERAKEYGISDRKVHEILHFAKSLEFVVPLNKVDKDEQLADVVFMSMIDGDIHEKEYDLCLRIAEKLDLSQKYLDHVISLTKKLWSAGT